MPDHVVDTNVLLIASAADPSSPFSDSDVPPELQLLVFEWVAALRADAGRTMVWDSLFTIYQEYRHQLTEQDYGLQVVNEKMETARYVELEHDAHGDAVVPDTFGGFDRSDQKFLATVLGDGGASSLVNASDTDWLGIEYELVMSGIVVEHLLEEWLRAKYTAKKGS